MAKQDISVRQLVDKVVSGELALPEMQRRYVWTSVKVRDLFDSLYRDYPSGAILVWEADPDIEDRGLQIQSVQTATSSTKLLLLDGQQRLTSLTAVLTGKPVTVRNKVKPIEILFNLDHPEGISDLEFEELDAEDDDDDDDEDEESDIMEEMRKRTFVVASGALKRDPKWISVSDVYIKSDSQLLKPLSINSDDPDWEKYSIRINKLRKIQEYQYVMQILDKKLTYEEVTEIFVRVNSLGAKLRGSDLALAQITSKWKGFIGTVDQFAKEFEGNEDFMLDSGVLVKTMVTFATNQSKFKTVNRIPLKKLNESWERAKSGLRFAINLIRNNARIDNLRLLGSPFLLIPIAYYCDLKKEKLSKSDEKKLMFWFYVAHMKQRYTIGGSENFLDIDISILSKSGGLDELLATLKTQVRDYFASVDDIKGKNRRSPYFSMIFFISKQKGIQDWFTGLAISERFVGKKHALQFHHIFPKSVLKKHDFDRRSINEIANMAFIGGKTNRNISNKEPEKYLQAVVKERGDDILEHHLLPNDRELWSVQNFDDFLEYRRAKIVETINNFLKQLIL